MRYLRQSTIVTVQVGPFLDSLDGVTPENGLSPTVQVSKAGAAFAARNSGTAITFDADGFYRVPLSATDTDTGGPLMLKSFVAGAAPVWHEFTIMSAARYDLAILGSGVQPVNLTQIDGLATAGNLATLNLKQLNIINTAGSAIVATSTGGNGHGMVVTGQGSGEGLSAQGGATGDGATFTGGATSGDGITAQGVGDGNGMSVMGGVSGSYGMYVYGDLYGLMVESNERAAAKFSAFDAGAPGIEIEGFDNADALLLRPNGTGHGIGVALTGSGKALADPIVDAILDRAITEPSGIWAWPATLRKVIGWIGVLSRNKVTQTNTTQAVRNDADSATIATSTHGDDGTTHTRGEFS